MAKSGKSPSKPAKPAAKPKPTTKVVAKAKAKPAPPARKPAAKPAPRPAAKPAADAALVRKPGTDRVAKPGTGRFAKPNTARFGKPVANSGGLASPFSVEELAEWRRTLLSQRSEISQDISHLEQDAMDAEDGHTTPNHIAERGSDAEVQDMSLGIAGEEHAVLWQIDRALVKIETGAPIPFGLCEHTKQPIPKTRLQLIPWTPLSIEGQTYVEENDLPVESVLVDG